MLTDPERDLLARMAAGAPREIVNDGRYDATIDATDRCGRSVSSREVHPEIGPAIITDITAMGRLALRVDTLIRAWGVTT